MDVFDLQGRIGLDLSSFVKGIEEAKESQQSVQKAMENVGEVSEAVQDKLGIFGTQYDATANSVEKLSEKLNKTVKETDASSEKTEQLTTELEKAKKEVADTEKEVDGLTESVDEYSDSTEQAKKKTSIFGEVLKANLATEAIKKGFEVMVSTIQQAVDAVGGLVQKSVDSYAEYEQLVGGVETLFKDSADIVQGYAEKAYKTAGLSANEYMETVTGFSASLLQSLGGDTETAAKYADTAIRDMSDNANKMGTSMESIQNAYQGFAKQNYTMLDNLKLGYGGTVSEMYRLLQDAADLNEDFAKSANFTMTEKGSLVAGYDEIIEAIHIVQTEMGISGISAEEAADMVEKGVLTQEEAYERMGTTAKEAATTIEGSVGSLKAAWENLVTGFARDDADIGGLIDALVTNAETAFNNILPVAERALVGIGNFVTQIAPVIGEKLPEILNTAIPSIIEAGTSFLTALLTGINNNLPMLLDGASSVASTLVAGILDNLPLVISLGLQLLLGLVKGIATALPELIPTVVDVVLQITETLIDNIDLLIDAAVELMVGLTEGIINALPKILEKAPIIIQKLGDAIIRNAPKISEASIEIILLLANAIIDNLPLLIESAIEIISYLIAVLIYQLPKLVGVAVELLGTLAKGILESLDKLTWVAADLILALLEEIIKAAGRLLKAGAEIVTKISDGVKPLFDKAKNWGKDLIDNFVGGIKSRWDELKQGAKDTADIIKQFLGFSEPEKGPLSNFHTYAPDMMKLFAQGIEDNTGLLTDQISRSFDFSDIMGGPNIQTQLAEMSLNRTAASNGGGRENASDRPINLYIDGKLLAKIMYPYNAAENQRVGINIAKGALT